MESLCILFHSSNKRILVDMDGARREKEKEELLLKKSLDPEMKGLYITCI
jgi:hypothetical protein